ncbi:diguanylate cyclase domain-containing protein [Cupriavidus basilensis]|uniref:diguanylate cyclase domain-containing protein n=1 Tax=Cupriavidus basilensis TaxID=68895 RepID=UPI00157AFE1E|nr:diguanylate cyclase [Cupriavidus basilensis]NUA30074.1 diguanylate cyclase [Cupriavidus basilensis]
MKLPLRPDAMRSRPTLYNTLRRIHLSVALIAVCTAGISLTALGLAALRVYADHNLHLVARSVAYTLEAPVVFRDQAAANEALVAIAATEVAQARVYDKDNRLLAEWQRPAGERFPGLQRLASRVMALGPVEQEILHETQAVGTVRLTADTGNLLRFVLSGLLGLLACLLLTAVSAHYMSSRMLVHIIEPVRNLMRVAHAVRSERAFDQRTPPAHIAELNALGEDFNGLLDELETWQNQLQHENRSLAHRASHDSLTGLLNRAAFEDALHRAVRFASTSKGYAGVLYLDSDAFKEINDNFGHAAGDEVLSDIARRIRSCVREGDPVARLGGDEFAVLLTSLRKPADIVQVAEHILLRMKDPVQLSSGTSVGASLSIGLSVFPLHAQTAATLMHTADEAMYRAKRRSGGGWASAEPRLASAGPALASECEDNEK